MKKILPILLLLLLLVACRHEVQNPTRVDELPPIYPDYLGVTIPVGIAPMNFDFEGGAHDWLDVVVKGSKGGELHSNGESVDFDIDEWHDLLAQNRGGELTFTLCVENGGLWTQYRDFKMYVSPYDLDEWGLTYRRVAPGYEVYAHMGLYQRDLATFDEYEILSNTRTPGACVNCHTSNRTDPRSFLFHVRGDHGATALQKDGHLEMLDTKTDQTLGLCVYPYWHPDGRFVAFSTNTTRQAFHVVKDERIEVFDHESDLQVLDTETHQLLLSPLLKTDSHNETYPVFSPDGRTLYFCTAQKREFPLEARKVRYNLCSIGFDAATGTFGTEVDTLIHAEADSMSVAFPRPSYDGRYLMLTLAHYGTFPIWHKEADLYLLDLQTRSLRAMDEVNSPDTESFHNWSDNSHWFVFSSRRGDGLYTRLYLASLDEKGRATKPFLLPQRRPRAFYNRLMYSYNTPDFTKSKVELDARQAANEILSEKRTGLSVRP